MDDMYYDEELETVVIPSELENIKLPNPSLMNYFKDASRRIYYIEGDIDDCTMEIVKKIHRYNIEDRYVAVEQRKPIRLFINSRGGDLQVMWCIVNAICMSKTPVYTIAFCNCMSAAAHILAAGHKRYSMPGTTILVHSGSCSFGGDMEKVESAKKYFDVLGNRANALLLKQTKISPKSLKRKGANDWYMSPEEALSEGIIDKIVDDFEEIG
jgi:ATP-dependent Clp protease, protease subunit